MVIRRALVSCVALFGCNAIVGIEPGTLGTESSRAEVDESVQYGPPPSSSRDAGDAAAADAELGCRPGYADCNGDPSDGCETDLSLATSCGGCNVKCGPNTPVCVLGPRGVTCDTGCTAMAPILCGTSCSDLTNDAKHCGSCGNACPGIPNGYATCKEKVCGTECNAGAHRCGADCVSNKSPATCGASCTPCPSAPNASPTCDGVSCGLRCTGEFEDCDRSPANGCEVDTSSDPKNCNGCGRACRAGEVCLNGNCRLP